MIDRYHLRYFLAVVDTGNFSRGAAACNVSQPTLSVGIAKLERSLERPLFNRTNRRVELTEAGTRLLYHARAIEAGFATAEREVLGAETKRTFRLGVMSTMPRRWVEIFLGERRSLSGDDRVEIIEGKERDLRGRLARGRIDAGLLLIRDGSDLAAGQQLLTEGYSLALGSMHALAAREHVRVEELAGEPMILRRHCELLPETSRFFTAQGIRPFFPSRTTSDDKALSYVRAGLGVTVMPDGFREPGISRVRLDGFDFTREIGIVFAAHVDRQAPSSRQVLSAITAALAHDEAH